MAQEDLAKIKNIVKKLASAEDWQYHILPVLTYSRKLGKKLEADREVIELAALLHDIGRLKYGDKDHHLTGAQEAEKILRKYNYPPALIRRVKHCIEAHRSQHGPRPKTIEAKVIANADGMVHFDILPLYFYWQAKKQNFNEALEWVEKKYQKSWNRKVTLPEARAMVREKYQTIKQILKWLRDIS